MSVIEGSLFQPATSFTFLEYIIFWCKIQVMINPFVQDLGWKSLMQIRRRKEFSTLHKVSLLKLISCIWYKDFFLLKSIKPYMIMMTIPWHGKRKVVGQLRYGLKTAVIAFPNRTILYYLNLIVIFSIKESQI